MIGYDALIYTIVSKILTSFNAYSNTVKTLPMYRGLLK